MTGAWLIRFVCAEVFTAGRLALAPLQRSQDTSPSYATTAVPVTPQNPFPSVHSMPLLFLPSLFRNSKNTRGERGIFISCQASSRLPLSLVVWAKAITRSHSVQVGKSEAEQVKAEERKPDAINSRGHLRASPFEWGHNTYLT